MVQPNKQSMAKAVKSQKCSQTARMRIVKSMHDPITPQYYLLQKRMA